MSWPAALQTFMFWAAPVGYLEHCRAQYGPRFTLRAVGFPPLVFLSDRDDVKAMFGAPADVLHPGEGGGSIAPIVGDRSFMLLDETEHLAGRRTLLPGFHAKRVAEHAGMVTGVVRREIATWPRDTPFAAHPRLRGMTLEVVLRTLFGASGLLDEELLKNLQAKLLSMLSVTASPVFQVQSLRHGPGRVVWKRFLRDRDEVDRLLFGLIDAARACGHDSGDVLGMLLAARGSGESSLSREEIRDEVMSVILAGHETTSSELAWAFQLLAHNPEVQHRALAEMRGGDGDGYLEAVVNEVLRHRPVFMFAIPRAVKQPIEIGGQTFAPPVHLMACIYLMHHDPRAFPEPDRFLPERFLGGERPSPLWVPWGGGRRRCPGLHLALLEMRTVLRVVLEVAELRPVGRRIERPRWRSVIVTPHAGSRIVLADRSRFARYRG